MIQPIGMIQSAGKQDPELLRIMHELMMLGVTPTGNKQVDKAKLEQIKEEMQAKLQEAQKNQQNDKGIPQEELEKAKMELQKPGAMQLSELNKLYFLMHKMG